MTRKEHCYEGEPHSDFFFSSDSVISFLSLSFSGIVIFWLPVLSMENEKNANSAIRRFARSCKAGKRSLRGYSWSYIREAPLETKEEKKKEIPIALFAPRARRVVKAKWRNPNDDRCTVLSLCSLHAVDLAHTILEKRKRAENDSLSMTIWGV